MSNYLGVTEVNSRKTIKDDAEFVNLRQLYKRQSSRTDVDPQPPEPHREPGCLGNPAAHTLCLLPTILNNATPASVDSDCATVEIIDDQSNTVLSAPVDITGGVYISPEQMDDLGVFLGGPVFSTVAAADCPTLSFLGAAKPHVFSTQLATMLPAHSILPPSALEVEEIPEESSSDDEPMPTQSNQKTRVKTPTAPAQPRMMSLSALISNTKNKTRSSATSKKFDIPASGSFASSSFDASDDALATKELRRQRRAKEREKQRIARLAVRAPGIAPHAACVMTSGVVVMPPTSLPSEPVAKATSDSALTNPSQFNSSSTSTATSASRDTRAAWDAAVAGGAGSVIAYAHAAALGVDLTVAKRSAAVPPALHTARLYNPGSHATAVRVSVRAFFTPRLAAAIREAQGAAAGDGAAGVSGLEGAVGGGAGGASTGSSMKYASWDLSNVSLFSSVSRKPLATGPHVVARAATPSAALAALQAHKQDAAAAAARPPAASPAVRALCAALCSRAYWKAFLQGRYVAEGALVCVPLPALAAHAGVPQETVAALLQSADGSSQTKNHPVVQDHLLGLKVPSSASTAPVDASSFSTEGVCLYIESTYPAAPQRDTRGPADRRICVVRVGGSTSVRWAREEALEAALAGAHVSECWTAADKNAAAMDDVELSDEEKERDTETAETKPVSNLVVAPLSTHTGNPEIPSGLQKTDSSSAVHTLSQLLFFPVLHRASVAVLGVALPHGVLLHGQPGVGKTWAIRKALSEAVQLLLQTPWYNQYDAVTTPEPMRAALRLAASADSTTSTLPRGSSRSAAAADAVVLVPCLRLVGCDASGVMSHVPGESEARIKHIFETARSSTASFSVAPAQLENLPNEPYSLPVDAASPASSVDVLYPLLPPSQLAKLIAAQTAGKNRGDAPEQATGIPRRVRAVVLRSVLLVDELDGLCPKRDGDGVATSPAQARLVAQMLTLLDGFSNKAESKQDSSHLSSLPPPPLLVVGATNRPMAIDPAIRRPGRLDRELHVTPPNAQQRQRILAGYMAGCPAAEDVDWAVVADACVGYVGADLAALSREIKLAVVREAADACSREERERKMLAKEKRRQAKIARMTALLSGTPVSNSSEDNVAPAESLNASAAVSSSSSQDMPLVCARHIVAAMEKVGAASLRGNALTAFKHTSAMLARAKAQAETPQVDASTANSSSTGAQASDFAPDIGGLEDVKLRLQQCIEWPIRYAATYKRLGLKPPRGVLMHGPPGGGKTSIARALCTSVKASFFALDAAGVYSSLLGEAERYIRDVFNKARGNAPCIVFIDEIDTLVHKRDMGDGGQQGSDVSSRILSTLLNEMDGVENCEGVLIVAATNRIDKIDAALMRPGRFEHVICVPPPDVRGCEAILRAHCRRKPLSADVDLAVIAQRTYDVLSHSADGVSGARVCNVVREAAVRALRRYTTMDVTNSTQNLASLLGADQAASSNAAVADSAINIRVEISSGDFMGYLDSIDVCPQNKLFSANATVYV